MAVVYRARERQLEREVAIKVLPFAVVHDAELVERFLREARLSAQLEHPNIVPIHRVGRSGQVIYFVMKLLRGQSLAARIATQGRLPAPEVRRVLSETASALGHAHQQGIVHRDVKPDNIMLDAAGRCVVTDFGIARSGAETRLTAAGLSLGTPRYMSPEQARAGELDGRSDLYSLGAVGYECLVGHPPFDRGDVVSILLDHVQSPVPRPTIATAGTAEERALYDVVERLLAKRPEDRFQRAEECIDALRPTGPASGRARGVLLPPVATVASDSIGRAPQSSAALDSALEAGLDMLRQQRPRIRAGVAAAQRAAEVNSPRLRAAVDDAGARAMRGVVAISSLLSPRIAAARAWISARTRRFWTASLGGTAAVWLAYAAGRYALAQRSRCPRMANSQSSADSAAVPRSQPFTVLLDPVGSVRSGSNVDVYYDICGLGGGTVKTHITVTKNESGLRRLLGDGAEPVSVREEDAITGPAMRRHRTIDFGNMPAGSYTLDLVVRDDKGRVREAELSFPLTGR
jgi:hypothetical protein